MLTRKPEYRDVYKDEQNEMLYVATACNDEIKYLIKHADGTVDCKIHEQRLDWFMKFMEDKWYLGKSKNDIDFIFEVEND